MFGLTLGILYFTIFLQGVQRDELAQAKHPLGHIDIGSINQITNAISDLLDTLKDNQNLDPDTVSQYLSWINQWQSILQEGKIRATRSVDDAWSIVATAQMRAIDAERRAAEALKSQQRIRSQLEDAQKEKERKTLQLAELQRNYERAQSLYQIEKANAEIAKKQLDNAQSNLITANETLKKLSESERKLRSKLQSVLAQLTIANNEIRKLLPDAQRTRILSNAMALLDRIASEEDLTKKFQLAYLIARVWYDFNHTVPPGIEEILLGALGPIESFGSVAAPARRLRFLPPGAGFLAAASLSGVILWSTEDGDIVNSLIEPGAHVVDVSPNVVGTNIAAAALDGTIYIWSIIRDKRYPPVIARKGSANTVSSSDSIAVSFGPNSALVTISQKDDRKAEVIEAFSGRIRSILTGHSSKISSVAFSHSGKLVATASADNTVRLWQPDGRLIGVLVGSVSSLIDIAFDATDMHIASIGDDAILRVWDLGGLQNNESSSPHLNAAFTIDVGSAGPNALVYHPTLSRIVAACQDGSLRFWSAKTGSLMFCVNVSTYPLVDLDISGDGKRLAVVDSVGNISVLVSDLDDLMSFSSTYAHTLPPLDGGVLSLMQLLK